MSDTYTTKATPAQKAAFKAAFDFKPPFADIVCNLQSSLDEEVWFDDSDWDPAFNWGEDADAVWQAIAEDADELTALRPRNANDLAQQRMSGLIARAIRSQSLVEIDDVLARSAWCLDAAKRLCTPEVHYLLAEAHECLDRMVCLAGAQIAEEEASALPWSHSLAA
ncbi:hypothetical protein [Roseovarius nanhaiticus]|uniref:hypothetical protein n=1 Tax=Roseovarius nanhaiticus TaxID=573024 RepID=UPI002491EF51|nr:hypothetical protein [Roseovarius nanhaiticus]